MKKISIFLLVTIILLTTMNVFAETPKPTDDFYVLDNANLLKADMKSNVISTNVKLQKQTGAQVVIVTIDSLEGENINKYATKLFNEWGIGDEKKDNGVLMLMSLKDKEIWIEVGYGLEGALPDSKVKGIIDKVIIPNFKNSEYSLGLERGFSSIMSVIQEDYNLTIGEFEDYDKSIGYGGFLYMYFISMVFIVLIISVTLMLTGRIDVGSGGGGSSGGGGAGGGW